MAKCACGKREIPQKKEDWQRAQAERSDSAHSCSCGCAGVAAQGGLGLRAASATLGVRPADQSGGWRMLGLRGI